MAILLVFSILAWPLMYSSIYSRENTRVAATRWIFGHIPENAKVLNEHWDDPLPLGNVDVGFRRMYRGQEMPVFNPDDLEKIRLLKNRLAEADYYFISSNRGWGSMMSVPYKYPLTAKFYRDLFAGKLGYRKIAEFTSFPRLEIGNWKLEINDERSEEAFTVYDHPKVMIFKKI